MIRRAIPQDTAALMALAEASDMFAAHELDVFARIVPALFDGARDDNHRWLVDDDGGVQGAAYVAPDVMAAGVWNLLFIAVHARQRRHGRGAALLRDIKRTLGEESGARLLIVETSGLDAFEPARSFYRKNGFDEEARIRDFYNAGEDKIVFRKALALG